MIVAGCDWGAWGQPGNDRCTKRRIANPPQAASLPYMPKQNGQISEADCKSAALKTCRTMIVAGCDWGAWGNRGMIGVRRGGLPIRRRLPACPTCRSKMAKFRRPIANRPQVENLPYYDRRGLRLGSVGAT